MPEAARKESQSDGRAMSHAPADIVEAVERAAMQTSDAVEIWHRVRAEMPDVTFADITIARRLLQARMQIVRGNWAAATDYGVQLARDLNADGAMPAIDAWAFLRAMDHPLAGELVRLCDEGPRAA